MFECESMCTQVRVCECVYGWVSVYEYECKGEFVGGCECVHECICVCQSVGVQVSM